MKTSFLIPLLIGAVSISCQPDNFPPEMQALQDRFHGKYKVVTSVSNEPLDVNLDGRPSVNMLQEIPELANDHLEMHIYGPSSHRSSASFLFLQWWPEQYIYLDSGEWKLEPISYNPKLVVNYAMQGATRTFSFSRDLESIKLGDSDADSSLRWKQPESIRVVGEHTIKVVNKKTLYTREGVKEVIITTTYERFTTAT